MRANLAAIRRIREAKGLTQAQVAQKLGYRSVPGYCRIETGHRRIRLEHIGPLAEILGVNVSEILDTDSVSASD
jgi:transcriptional regulator with XRE-family HTH domain